MDFITGNDLSEVLVKPEVTAVPLGTEHLYKLA